MAKRTMKQQHIDWLNMGEGSVYPITRPIESSTHSFKWSGVLDSPFSSAAPQEAGRDEFQGVYASTNRIFPAAIQGQAMPPPFVTAVVKVLHQNGGVQVAEARKRIFIPQVVKIEYEAAAIEFLKSGLATTNSGVVTTIIEPMTNAEWATQKARICTIAQAFYDATDSNVRFVSDDVFAVRPYSTLKMMSAQSYSYGIARMDELNINPNDEAKLYVKTFISAVVNKVGDEESPLGTPLTRDEVGFFWSHVASHETGHMLGLVASGVILDGSLPGFGDRRGGHNKNPNDLCIMNPGKFDNLDKKLGRNGIWGWRLKNANYLKFVLPKKENSNEN